MKDEIAITYVTSGFYLKGGLIIIISSQKMAKDDVLPVFSKVMDLPHFFTWITGALHSLECSRSALHT